MVPRLMLKLTSTVLLCDLCVLDRIEGFNVRKPATADSEPEEYRLVKLSLEKLLNFSLFVSHFINCG